MFSISFPLLSLKVTIAFGRFLSRFTVIFNSYGVSSISSIDVPSVIIFFISIFLLSDKSFFTGTSNSQLPLYSFVLLVESIS